MSGKSVQRSFRGNLLMDRCINDLVVSDLLEDDTPFQSLIDEAVKIYLSLVERETTLERAVASDMLTQIKEKPQHKVKN